MNFFKLYIGDYQRDTGVLSLAEHGAYLLMLQHIYATEKPLPKGRDLYRILRANGRKERSVVDRVCDQFFTETDDGWVNERALQEIEKSAERRELNRELGRRGGRPKGSGKKTETVSNENRNGNRKETETVSEKNPNQTPDTNKPPSPSLRSGASPSGGKTQSAKQGTRIPEDFAVTTELAEWATQNFPAVDQRLETEKFIDFWRAKPGVAGRKLDWPATWRNWIRRAAERPPAGGSAHAPRQRPLSAVERVREANRRAEEAERAGLRIVAGQRID